MQNTEKKDGYFEINFEQFMAKNIIIENEVWSVKFTFNFSGLTGLWTIKFAVE